MVSMPKAKKKKVEAEPTAVEEGEEGAAAPEIADAPLAAVDGSSAGSTLDAGTLHSALMRLLGYLRTTTARVLRFRPDASREIDVYSDASCVGLRVIPCLAVWSCTWVAPSPGGRAVSGPSLRPLQKRNTLLLRLRVERACMRVILSTLSAFLSLDLPPCSLIAKQL